METTQSEAKLPGMPDSFPQPSEATLRFIAAHRMEDVRGLALRCGGRGRGVGATSAADGEGGVDLPFALDQIAGWQAARRKLPTWAAVAGIFYPPHLNMEQCSSEQTARYKASLCQAAGLAVHAPSVLYDLTGGFGVDFAIMAPCFDRAVYVERDGRLCALARHNFPLLGLRNAEVVCADGVDFLTRLPLPEDGKPSIPSPQPHATVFLDPARRDIHGRRVYDIGDCTPNLLEIRGLLLRHADRVVVKLSPMLDWHAAVKSLGDCCREVHILSVRNECKELLVVMGKPIPPSASPTGGEEPCGANALRVVCVNDEQRFSYRLSSSPPPVRLAQPGALMGLCGACALQSLEHEGRAMGGQGEVFLFVPNASVMKAGCFAQLTAAFPLSMVDRDSHLFLGREPTDGFPGRRFRLVAVSTMHKRYLRDALRGIDRASVSVRNFPLTADELRRKLRLKDGGDAYLFATTMQGCRLIFVARRLAQGGERGTQG